MRDETKAFLKELIDFYEASGRQNWTTIRHFVKNKKCSDGVARRWLKTYEREGIAILGRQTKPRKRPKSLMPHAVENAKRVLELLKEDPNISINVGAAMLNMSSTTFLMHKRRLTTPGLLTPEMKIQIGLVPATLPEAPSSSTASEDNEVTIKQEKFESEMFDDDDGGGHTFAEETQSSSVVISKTKPKNPFQHCLMCSVRLEKSSGKNSKSLRSDNASVPIVTSSFANDCGDEGELGANLNVIFALKNIFGLTSSDLVNVMRATKGRDPKEWYNLCGSCDVILKEAVAIQHQVLQLSRELDKCKRRIEGKIKDRSNSNVNGDNGGVGVGVAKLIRESMLRSKKINSVEADASVVKQEPQDDADEYEHDWEPGNAVNDGDGMNTNGADANDMSFSATDLPELPVKPKLVVCETCGEEMRPSQLPMHALRVHDIIMEGFTVFKCHKEGCKYTSISKSLFKKHVIEVHTPYEKRKHVCQTCGKRFPIKGKLSEHEKTHTNAITKPYQCEICGSSFAVYSTLHYHRKCVHEKNPKYTTRKKRDPATLQKAKSSRIKGKNDTVAANAELLNNSAAVSHNTPEANEGSRLSYAILE